MTFLTFSTLLTKPDDMLQYILVFRIIFKHTHTPLFVFYCNTYFIYIENKGSVQIQTVHKYIYLTNNVSGKLLIK